MKFLSTLAFAAMAAFATPSMASQDMFDTTNIGTYELNIDPAALGPTDLALGDGGVLIIDRQLGLDVFDQAAAGTTLEVVGALIYKNGTIDIAEIAPLAPQALEVASLPDPSGPSTDIDGPLAGITGYVAAT